MFEDDDTFVPTQEQEREVRDFLNLDSDGVEA